MNAVTSDTELLKTVLLYHVVPGKITSDKVCSFYYLIFKFLMNLVMQVTDGAVVATVEGSSVTASVQNYYRGGAVSDKAAAVIAKTNQYIFRASRSMTARLSRQMLWRAMESSISLTASYFHHQPQVKHDATQSRNHGLSKKYQNHLYFNEIHIEFT